MEALPSMDPMRADSPSADRGTPALRVDLLAFPRSLGAWLAPTPEQLLPAQLTWGARIGADVQPEKRLMLAVLEQAVDEVRRGAGDPSLARRRPFVEASAWLAADDLGWPYSFLNVCLVLGFDAGAVRTGLRRRFGPGAVRALPPRLPAAGRRRRRHHAHDQPALVSHRGS
jgi:hypothetical protein